MKTKLIVNSKSLKKRHAYFRFPLIQLLRLFSILYFEKIFNEHSAYCFLEAIISSGLDNILDPNEQVIWSAKPDKKAFMLPAFGGIFFAVVFLGITSIFLMAGLPFLESPAVITIPIAIALIVVPPLWQYRKMPHSAYMITNQRLIIKSGITKEDVWFADLDHIKDTIVKIGLVDKRLGTGKLYPITPAYPYEPKLRGYTEGGMYRSTRVFNIVEQKYEEIPEIELYRKSQMHPHLIGLKEPFAVQKLLKEVIFGAGTNFVSCEYCNYRYDLNKEGKCPHCGGAHPQNYSL